MRYWPMRFDCFILNLPAPQGIALLEFPLEDV